MSADGTDECTMCNKIGARLCKGCQSARYCSVSCQKKDWPTHKLLCATFFAFDNPSRPSKEHVRAIFFPVDDKRPTIVWLHCEWGLHGYQHPDAEPFLGLAVYERHASIQQNPTLTKTLLHTIKLAYDDDHLNDDDKFPRNKSIRSITATRPWPGEYHDWRGPVLAYGKVGLGVDQAACRDIDVVDFRHIVDCLMSYDAKPEYLRHDANSSKPSTESSDTKILGVRINCVGDQGTCNRPQFEAVELSPSDPIFREHDTSDTADRIGLPIFTRRLPPDPKWLAKTLLDGPKGFENVDATRLHHCLDLEADYDPASGKLGWGWCSSQWQSRVGSTIIVRQDKKPLSVLHAEALYRYCRFDVGPILAHTLGEYAPDKRMSKKTALRIICRPMLCDSLVQAA
ncbi:uncharacterized protein LTR77_001341 [Saxophila tyrrhenica]|uniref:MYND-type domain-containing protein n=1 Tax=Saxophila tyrrhenica TaxID=1690608 RepID=A0AAV9PMZ7_9PEZI|nr:hypothetical protein LTR77_001341 [Saxophila tyrrhenica]